jgi:hypothetical protein
MSTEQYNKLLQIMDEISSNNDYDITEDIDPSVLELEPLPKYSFGQYFNELSIILSANMFRDGQLKEAIGYNRSYRINDFIEFIWCLCKKMHDFTPISAEEQEFKSFLNLMEAIEDCIPDIRRLFGKREESQITKLKEKIETWLSNAPEFSLLFPISERQLSEDITGIFKKNIPHAPEEIISAGVCKFLKLLWINYKPKTLTMRAYRKRKAFPEK